MLNGNQITGFTAADIERYQQGRLTPAEMHAMEKAALEDPFLADALEGFAFAGPSLQQDLGDLRNRLAERGEQSKVIPLVKPVNKSYTWLKIAAMLVIVAGAAFLVYQFGSGEKQPAIAQEEMRTNKATETATGNNTATLDSVNAASDLSAGNPSTTSHDSAASAANPKTSGSGTASTNTEVAGDVAGPEGNLAKAAPFTPQPYNNNLDSSGSNVPQQSEASASLLPGKITMEQIAAKKQDARKEEKEKDRLAMANAGVKTTQVGTAYGYATADRNQQTSNRFSGRVIDANNNALPFVNITNTQDNIGTYTDAKGNFVLTSPDSTLDVRVRSLGFESQAVELKANAPVAINKIVLSESDTLSAVVINRQKVNSDRPRSSTRILEAAEPIDGWRNYDTYIANNLKEPANEKGRPTRTGEVELSFEVDKNGEPVNITVVRSLCDSCDREAIRLLRDGPKWKKKARRGRTSVTIPF